MNIIFLDVDGVLNSSAYFEQLLEASFPFPGSGRCEISGHYLKMLAEIYHTCDARIVLSSSWRTLNDRSDKEAHGMYQYLEQSLARYGMTIMSQTPILGMNRPLEIKSWLNGRTDKKTLRFVSLDDNFTRADYEKYGIGYCLVPTVFFCEDMSKGGLGKKQVKWAVRKLKWHPVFIRLLSKVCHI